MRSLIEIYRRRRDVMLDSLAEHFPREAQWTHPQGGLFIWATLPDYIDTTDLLARALEEHVAFVPGRAAFVDGRGGSSMRLNFSGVNEDEIREGIRRIGEVVREQVALYGTLTGAAAAGRRQQTPSAQPGGRDPAERGRRAREGARLPRERRRRCRQRCRRRAGMSRVAVLKGGRSLERQVSLKSGARVEDALERLGHDVSPIDVGGDLVDRLTAAGPDVAFVALHGRDGEDGTVQELLEVMGIPYTGSGVSACIRCADKVLAKHAMRDHGIPTPDFYCIQRDRVQGARRRAGAAGDRGAAPVPDRRQARGAGLGAWDQVRAHARRRSGGAGRSVLL